MTRDAAVGPECVPRISGGFRMQFEPAQSAWVLLYPEGMVRLSPSAAEVLKRVDGARTIDAVVASLEQAFPGANLRSDVLEFLDTARRHGWIDV